MTEPRIFNLACLFGGGSLSSLGLALAGHRVTSVESEPRKHALALALSAAHGNAFACVLSDVRDFDLAPYDAIWASPPCSERSGLNHRNRAIDAYGVDLMPWCLERLVDCGKVTWIENTRSTGKGHGQNTWGRWWNAAQFTPVPIQCRNRLIGGNHAAPSVYHEFRRSWPGVCPAIHSKVGQLSQLRCGKKTRHNMSNPVKHYNRVLTIDEAAYHQGLAVPPAWRALTGTELLYDTIAKGVPVYMAEAFGLAYSQPYDRPDGQFPLF